VVGFDVVDNEEEVLIGGEVGDGIGVVVLGGPGIHW
jgi:hypothetical protein